MRIKKNMLYRYPELKSFLEATEIEVIQQSIHQLRATYTFHLEHHDGRISGKCYTLPEIIASQGCTSHADAVLEADPAVPNTLMNMLHCAIEHHQHEMIDYCVNHPQFDRSLITSETLEHAAHDGPALFFKQLFETYYPALLDKKPQLSLQLAYSATSGGQHKILKTLLAHNPNLTNHIVSELGHANTFQLGPLHNTIEHHHTDVVAFLLTFGPIQRLLPTNFGIFLLNHAIRCQHAGAVNLLLKFESIQAHLRTPPIRHQNNTLLCAASAGNAYIFQDLLHVDNLRQDLLTDRSYMNAFRGQPQVTNAWTSAIRAGHVDIARIIYDAVSVAERETLKTDTSVLALAMSVEQPDNANMLSYLLSFDAMEEAFNQHALHYMNMACCIFPEHEVVQPRVRESAIPLTNVLLDTPIIRKKLSEGDEELCKLVNLFVNLQMALLKSIPTNAPPLSLPRYTNFLDLLQKTKYYRPKDSTHINDLANMPHTLCDDAGVMNPRIKRLLPWTQYRTASQPTYSRSFRFLEEHKRKRDPDNDHDEQASSPSYHQHTQA